MDETTIDRAALGRLSKALAFICGADHPTTVALREAAENGSEREIVDKRPGGISIFRTCIRVIPIDINKIQLIRFDVNDRIDQSQINDFGMFASNKLEQRCIIDICGNVAEV